MDVVRTLCCDDRGEETKDEEEGEEDAPPKVDDINPESIDVAEIWVYVEARETAITAEDCDELAPAGAGVRIAATCAVFAGVKLWPTRFFIEQVPEPTPAAAWPSDRKVNAVQITPSVVKELSQSEKQSLKPLPTL